MKNSNLREKNDEKRIRHGRGSVCVGDTTIAQMADIFSFFFVSIVDKRDGETLLSIIIGAEVETGSAVSK